MKTTSIFHAIIASRQIKTLVIRDVSHINEEERKLLELYNQMRTNYVQQEGWPIDASGVDIDVYDVAVSSVYVIAYINSTVIAGMRLTPISSIYGSLSYSMWQHAIDRESFENRLQLHHVNISELEAAGSRGQLWDISRLISIGSFVGPMSRKRKIESRIGVLKTMAAAVAVAGSHTDSMWIFTISQKVYDFFRRNHVPFHSLASGTITAGDQSITHFCYLYPQGIIDGLKDANPAAYRVAHKERQYHYTKSGS